MSEDVSSWISMLKVTIGVMERFLLKTEVSMKIRLAKKIMKADIYADYPSKHPSPFWKAKFNEAYNGYGCFMFCDDRSKCKYRNKFDNRIKKAINLTK
jgi:hypothetical protein